MYPFHEDVNLLDLFNRFTRSNNTLSQIITTVNVPNAKYEEVEFKFEKSIIAGEWQNLHD
jgi:hypothetical protein